MTAARWEWALAGAGMCAAAVAVGTAPIAARAAASANWPPFVLVAGLLLVGLVADGDGLFAAAGAALARRARHHLALYAWSSALVVGVTALLNLDTSVAFLTPVVAHAARARRTSAEPLVAACLLLSNAGSLLLPGSNLTNLIVVGHLHLTGGAFARRMALPWAAAAVVTAAVVALAHRRCLRGRDASPSIGAPAGRVGSVGAVAVGTTAVAVLVLRNPALVVLGVGLAATAVQLVRRRHPAWIVVETLGLPQLVGLAGVAIGLGAAGRVWDVPSRVLAHLGTWATATVAAGVSVLVNNLPAASLLAARPPNHPLALLVGLNVGPNLFATGSLSWLLWLRAARLAGERPSIAATARLGALSVPVAGAAAVLALGITAGH